ncbi:hypothetical protein RI367_003418 [Sorochytrium milnesiophthora]
MSSASESDINLAGALPLLKHSSEHLMFTITQLAEGLGDANYLADIQAAHNRLVTVTRLKIVAALGKQPVYGPVDNSVESRLDALTANVETILQAVSALQQAVSALQQAVSALQQARSPTGLAPMVLSSPDFPAQEAAQPPHQLAQAHAHREH